VRDSLQESAAEAGDERGLFGFYLALSRGRESASERESETGSGDVVSGKRGGDVAADVLPGGLLSFAARMKVAEIRINGAGHAAAAAVFEREQTQGRTVLGETSRHDDLLIE